MQYDIKSTHITGDGALYGSRTRLKGIQITGDGTAGDVIFKDGGVSGVTKLVIAISTSTAPFYMLLPGEGLLFDTSVYVDVPGSSNITIFYG